MNKIITGIVFVILGILYSLNFYIPSRKYEYTLVQISLALPYAFVLMALGTTMGILSGMSISKIPLNWAYAAKQEGRQSVLGLGLLIFIFLLSFAISRENVDLFEIPIGFNRSLNVFPMVIFFIPVAILTAGILRLYEGD